MAFQYLYTSARRGLEPGKSGFCCVARDRDLPVDLARELERLSRYDRIAGRSNPLILRHLPISARSGNYHALSRLRDAGADYSKRNNHIAHHLIFKQDEATTLPDPVTILLYWNGWKDAWHEPPRVLGERDRFDISALATPEETASTGFATLVEDGAIAKMALQIEEGQEIELATHYRNELLKLPAEDRWSAPFTNFILASDRPGDFAWLANWRDRDLPFELAPAPDNKEAAPPEKRPEPPAPEPVAAPSSASARFAQNAPTVEIPEELTRESRRRPKRKWTRRRFSTTLNLGIAAVAAICVGIVAYLAYNYKSPSSQTVDRESPLQSIAGPTEPSLERPPQARWDDWVARGELLENIERALPVAETLDANGHSTALGIARVIHEVAEKSGSLIAVPRNLVVQSADAWSLHSPLAEELVGMPYALVPQYLAEALGTLETYPVSRVYEQLLPSSFQSEDAAIGLSALRRFAKDRIVALDLDAVAAAREYRTLWHSLVDEGRLDSLRQLEAAFEINALAGFFATDDEGLLLTPDETNITEHVVRLYERFLMPRFSSFSADPEFRQALRATSQDFERPIDAARAIHNVFLAARAEPAPLQSRLETIREAWKTTFIRDDLMEETMIQFSFEGLANAKAKLAALQAQFDRTILQELENSETTLSDLDAIETQLRNLDPNASWLLAPLSDD